MSKSKGNVVNPTDVIESGYGADALRLSIAFLAPYDQTTPWSPEGVAGTHRFLARAWNLVKEFKESQENEQSSQDDKPLKQAVHKTIKKVSEDLDDLGFNTAIAAQMELINDLYKLKQQIPFTVSGWKEALISMVQLLAPFAPHIAEELWHELGQEGTVHSSGWPSFDESVLFSNTVTIVVQIDGKLRASIQMPAGSDQAAVEAAAREQESVKTHLSGEPKRVIYIPNKLLNFVR
jgi:leucyl-tRNA synthetase